MDYTYQNFLVDIDEDGIAVLTANRPEKMNAMNQTSWNELADFVRKSNEDDNIKVVIITGSGDKAFIAGADIGMLREKKPSQCLTGNTQEALFNIEKSAKPWIAAVNGYALGGGCEIALACDVRIASENARFGLPETGIGVLPGAGGTQRLARVIGLGRAKEVVLFGKQYKGAQAEAIGLANKCVPQENLMEEAKKMALRVCGKAPLAVQLAKRALQVSLSSSQDVGQFAEMLALATLCGTEDKNEGTSAFLEKRDPEYKRR